MISNDKTSPPGKTQAPHGRITELRLKSLLERLAATVIALTGVGAIIYYFFSLCSMPNLIRSVAISPSGSHIAISYHDHSSFGFSNYGGIATTILTVDENGVLEGEKTKRSANAKFVHAVDDEGRVITSDRTGRCFYSNRLNSIVSDQWNNVKESRFIANRTPRIITWSKEHVSVFAPGQSSSKWELPVCRGCDIVTCNWRVDPLVVAVLIVENTMPSSKYRSGRVELWLHGKDTPFECSNVPGQIDDSCMAAISPSGACVVVYDNSRGRQRTLKLWRKSQPEMFVNVADAPDIWMSQSEDHIRFIGESEVMLTDATGRMAILNTTTASIDYVDRSGDAINQLSSSDNGSVIAIATRLLPKCEIWRRDEDGLHPWLELGFGSKVSSRRLHVQREPVQQQNNINPER